MKSLGDLKLLRWKPVFACLLSICTTALYAVPADPRPVAKTQPDGTEISVRAVGDEFAHWVVDQNGYTIVKDQNGFFCYAELNDDGKLVPTTNIVGQVDPASLGLAQNIHPDLTAAMNARKDFLNELQQEKSKATSSPGGTVYKNLVLLVAFNDNYDSKNKTVVSNYGHPREEYDNLFNYDTISNGVDPYGVTPGGSVRDYWIYNSYRQAVIDSTVVEWIKLPYSSYDYLNKNYDYNLFGASEDDYFDEFGAFACRNMILHAWARLQARVASGELELDLSQFDKLTLVRSGFDDYTDDVRDLVWSHAAGLPSICVPGNTKIRGYATVPALRGSSGTNIVNIGVIVHELGHHAIGLPDVYDVAGDYHIYGGYGIDVESGGVGSWCVMGGGSWGFTNPAFPTHLCAPLKFESGFINPILLNPETNTFTPDANTDLGWGDYTLNASSIDKNAFALIALEPQELALRTNVHNIYDFNTVPGIIGNLGNKGSNDRYLIPPDSLNFIGGDNGSAFFRGGKNTGLPFDAGIVLSTGDVERAIGPNSSDDTSSGNGAGKNSIGALETMIRPKVVKDGKLENIEDKDYHECTTNAAGLSFNLLKDVRTIDFNCVIASEEQGAVPDVFAVIVDDTYGWVFSTVDNDLHRNITNTIPVHYTYFRDSDGDGINDFDDPDADGDGIDDINDGNIYYNDMDGDGIPDDIDPDADGDYVLDHPVMDPNDPTSLKNEDLNDNGKYDLLVGVTVNPDGTIDVTDCITDDSNPEYDYDYNGDGYLTCSEDINGDGILDHGDDLNGNGIQDVNEDLNGNGILDPSEDINGNGVLDLGEDVNGNGILDWGEDLNGNGILDPSEDLNENGILDLGEVDINGNGILDLGEEASDPINGFSFGEDINRNGILDAGDPEIIFIDTDGDGVHDDIDPDADNDRIWDRKMNNADCSPMVNEDVDGDGKLDLDLDVDTNENGELDPDEDFDGDGNWDIMEDINGDGFLYLAYTDPNTGEVTYGDPEIAIVDTDGDGIPDIDDEVFTFPMVKPIELNNKAFDNRRDGNPPFYRKDGKKGYNTEFDMFTDTLHVSLDMRELESLFKSPPAASEEGDTPTDVNYDGISDFLSKFIDINTETDESFNDFLDQDYHNIKIVVADRSTNDELVGLPNATGDTAVYIQYGSLFNSATNVEPLYGECLLVENRQRPKPFETLNVTSPQADENDYEGFEYTMPTEGGLQVWHLDYFAPWGNNLGGYPGLADYPYSGWHNRISLVQPDGRWDIEKSVNSGDAGDVYSAANYKELTPFTTPNTNAYAFGTVADTHVTISNISAADNFMSFVFMETGVYNDSIARPLDINSYAEFSDDGFNWWLGSGSYSSLWWKYVQSPTMRGISGMNLPQMPENYPRLEDDYIPAEYRIYGDTSTAYDSWIPNYFSEFRWEYGSPCAGYDWSTEPYDAVGDHKKPMDSAGLWYTFTAEKSGFVHLNTGSAGFDTTLSVFSEPNDVYFNNKNFLTNNFLACNDDTYSNDPGSYYTSDVDVYMEDGKTYLVRVGGYNYEAGDFVLSLEYRDMAVNDDPNFAIPLELNTPVMGDTIDASGSDITPEPDYLTDMVNGDNLDLWYSFTPELDGDYRITSCTQGFDSTLSVFLLGITSEGDALISYNNDPVNDTDFISGSCSQGSSLLSQYMDAGTTYYIRVAGSPASYGKFSIEITNRPANDECNNAIKTTDFDMFGQVYTGSTQFATKSYLSTGGMIRSDCLDGFTAVYDVWYSYTPKEDADVTLSLRGSDFDTSLAVYSDCNGGYLACNDNYTYFNQEFVFSELTYHMQAATKYYIRISGYGDEVGNYSLKVSGGRGDGRSALEIVANDTFYFADGASENGQDVNIMITAAGGYPNTAPDAAPYRDWTVEFPGSDQQDPYLKSTQTSSFVVPAENDRLNVSSNDMLINYQLPFSVLFYGSSYSDINISTNGFIAFGSGQGSLPYNIESDLIANKIIAPMWDDYRFNGSDFDIYVTEADDHIVVTWIAEYYGDLSNSGDKCLFSATISKNGTIRFDYGDMIAFADQSELFTTPTVGISSGDAAEYVYFSDYSYDSSNASTDDDVMRSLSNAPAIIFVPVLSSGELLPYGLDVINMENGINIKGTINRNYPTNIDGSPNFKFTVSVSDYGIPAGHAAREIEIFMVDTFDSSYLNAIIDNWMEADCGGSGDCGRADLNGDGIVNIFDFAVYALFGEMF